MHPAQTIPLSKSPTEYSRLLQLGDIAFGQKVEQRKTQKRVIAFPKTGAK